MRVIVPSDIDVGSGDKAWILPEGNYVYQFLFPSAQTSTRCGGVSERVCTTGALNRYGSGTAYEAPFWRSVNVELGNIGERRYAAFVINTARDVPGGGIAGYYSCTPCPAAAYENGVEIPIMTQTGIINSRPDALYIYPLYEAPT